MDQVYSSKAKNLLHSIKLRETIISFNIKFSPYQHVFNP